MSFRAMKNRRLDWQDVKPQRPPLVAAYEIAASQQGTVTRVFNDLFRSLQTKQVISKIRAAIKGQDTPLKIADAIIAALEDEWESARVAYERRLAKIVDLSGQATAEIGVEMPERFARLVKARVQYRFDLDNPFSQAFLQNRSNLIIRGIKLSTRQTIADILLDGFDEGKSIRAMSEEIQATMLLDPRGRASVQAAKKRNIDLLLREGRSLDEAKEMADRIARQFAGGKLSERAVKIARTETINAEAAGVENSWQAAQDQGFLPPQAMKVWIATPQSLRTCKVCRELHHADPIPLNDNFSGGIERPPAHPNCRCTIGLVFPETEDE